MTAFDQRFQAGVNLGGWLSQYDSFDHDHFETFVGESDLRRIADWGMDHVRVPVDYPVLGGETGTDYDERGFGYVDDCLQWCRERDLGLILDLHRAPGYSFGDPEGSRLFEEPELQQRFVDLWRTIAERYESAGEELAFELLNEVVEAPGDAWNELAGRALAAIREVDEDRTVLVGGEHYNAVDALSDIERFDDEHVVYTFHCYEPHLFTHQHADWVPAAREYDTDVEYPGTFPDLGSFLDDSPEHADQYSEYVGERIDREWVEAALQPAIDFREATDAPVYCGEYGVIEGAPAASRRRWHEDVVDVLAEAGIGRACWSYREMDFGLVDGAGELRDERLVEIVSRR